MATRLAWAAKTDVGLKRTRNEDNYIMVPSQGLYVLADGMGGHSSGQVASTLCVKHVSQFICEIARQPGFELMYPPYPNISFEANVLVNAIKFANERVYIQSCKDRSMEGMGTTVTAVFNAPQGFILAWVGDSRIYRIRNGQIQQMSRDHSLINHLLDTGELKPENVKAFGNKNVILRAIGLKENVEVSVKEVKREQGDVYLMCSDGLSDLVSDAQIAQTVSSSPTLQEACNTLIGLALKAGGKDNVTVVTVGVEQEDNTTAQPAIQQRSPSSQGLPAQGQSQPGYPQPMPMPMSQPMPHSTPGTPKASRAGMPPVGMPRPVGMAPMPGATGAIAPAVTRLHSVREYVLLDTAVPTAKRTMPKPPTSRAAMPAIPGMGPAKPLNEPVPDEALDSKTSYDEDDEDDENCATKIQSREEILREIGMLAAAPAAPPAAPPADAPTADRPRLVTAPSSPEEEPAVLPNTELLLTAPPTVADDFLNEATSIEDALPEEMAKTVVGPAPTKPSGIPDAPKAAAPYQQPPRYNKPPLPSSSPASAQPRHSSYDDDDDDSIEIMVSPSGAPASYSGYDDDDDDSIEISDSLFGNDPDVLNRYGKLPFRK